MSSGRSLDDTVAHLAADLRPVRRLPSPSARAAGWIGVVAVMAAGLACFCDLPALGVRLSIAPDMWIAVVGSGTTTMLAALAAFQLSVPGRSPRWALLPVPTLLLWIAASGSGCLRTWGASRWAVTTWQTPPGLDHSPVGEAGHCFGHIVMMSVPLTAVMVVMLRRACPLRPNLTALVSGLAVAAAAATLLNFDHTFDASAMDLLAHLAAVLLVIGANQVVAMRVV